VVSPSHLDFVLTRTDIYNVDLKLGQTYGAYFFSLDSLRITGKEQTDVSWLQQVIPLVELTLSRANATAVGSLALLSAAIFAML